MTRFFFTVNEAVNLVVAGLDNIDTLHGKVLSRTMRAASIRELLDVWIENFGGKWEKIEGRPGDRNYEALISEVETKFTTTQMINGILHYVITFNKEQNNCLKEAVTSDNAERLTKQELLNIITKPPKE